jgi:nucleoside-diphosphate-sugar epimerase
MKKICVLGANGFVGKAICDEIAKTNYHLIKVTRNDNIEFLIKESDIIIHSANSSKRYFANQNPNIDLFDTVEKMLKIIKYANGKKIILISTISARTQKNTPYGKHRKICELLLDEKKDLILRMSNMFGKNNNKGVLHDIINNLDVYASNTTKCAFVDVQYNASKVINFINNTGIIERGAKNFIVLGEIAKRINSSSKFVGADDTQLPNNVPDDAPDVNEVFNFIKNFNGEKK